MRSGYRLRRATIDDLPGLQTMWRALALPVAELQNRLTEFQVIETPAGLLGAVGFEIAGQEGRVHSEVFSDFGYADHFRPLFWERLEALARSHSVIRIWTLETSPFWKRCGLRPANAAGLKALPPEWLARGPGWLCIPLREQLDRAKVEQQVASLRAVERERVRRRARLATWLKRLALLAAVLLALFVMFALAYLLKHNPPSSGR